MSADLERPDGAPPEPSADRPGADAQALWDLAWPERHGAPFAWTPADSRAFLRDHKAHLARRRRGRAAAVRLLLWLAGACVGLLAVAAAVVAATLLRQPYAEPSSNLIAGAILGATAAGVALVLAGLVAARGDYAVDPAHAFTTARVGVEEGALWFYRHRTLVVFRSQDAFVDLARSDDLVLAFVNRFTAYAFPRSALAASPEGREVLDWFQARWPDRPAPDAPAGRRSRADAAWRRLPRSLRLAVALGLGMGVVYAAGTLADLWRAAHPLVR